MTKSISEYHLFKRKRGRPKRRFAFGLASLGSKKAIKSTVTKAKPTLAKRRTNWALPENVPILEAAVDDWMSKKGKAVNKSGKPIKFLTVYAKVVGIPYNTLSKYVTRNDNSQRTVGNQPGKKPLI